MSKERNVEQLILESNNYPLIIETIISSMIQDKLIDFKISLLVINKIIDILDNYKIELDDKVIVELISLNGYFIQIINCLSENLDIINDKKVLMIIKSISEFSNITLENYKCDSIDNNQVVDGVKEYISSISDIPLLSAEEEKALALKVKNGDKDARKKFIESNLRLVIDIVKKYDGYGLTYMDLIQEGNLALMYAVNRFDVTLGYKFSTFSTIIINQKVSRAIYSKGTQIRLPEYLYKKIKLIKKTYTDLSNKLGREVTYFDISNELGISVKEIDYLYSLQNNPLSLNSKVNDDEYIETIDLLPSLDDIEDDYAKKDLLNQILLLINKSGLNEREKRVLLLRYGFIGEREWSLKEIGRLYGLTGERIRQIENRALKKIRSSKSLKKVDDYALKPGKI